MSNVVSVHAIPGVLAIRPRFRTLPPADVTYRSAQLDALVAEAFAAKQRPAHVSTRCPACTFPIDIRERIARTADGAVFHAGCQPGSWR